MIAFSSLTTETESPKNKQRTAHEQEQKVSGFNHSRYVDQASLIYILAACHSASLAEEVTWAPLPPAWRKYHENTETQSHRRRVLHEEIVKNQHRRHHNEGASTSNWSSQVQVLHLLRWFTHTPRSSGAVLKECTSVVAGSENTETKGLRTCIQRWSYR